MSRSRPNALCALPLSKFAPSRSRVSLVEPISAMGQNPWHDPLAWSRSLLSQLLRHPFHVLDRLVSR